MYRSILKASLMAALVFIGGCSKNADSIVEPGNGGNGENGDGIVSPEQRRATVDSILAFAEHLAGSPAQDNEQIVEFAKRLSVVEAAGVEGGNAWARFKDGKLLLIGGFRPTVEEDGPLSSAVSASPKASAVVFVSNAVTGVPDMPTTNQIRILNSLGAAFDPNPSAGFANAASRFRHARIVY